MTRAPGPSAERLIALGLVALGALLVLSSASRPRVSIGGVTLEGGQADVPGGTALALVALAGAAAALLVRGWARAVVGVLVVGAGVAAFALNLSARHGDFALTSFAPLGDGPQPLQLTAWFWLTAAGAVLLVAGGAAVATRGHRWPSSRRDFDAPAATRVRRPDPWSALDQGEDPTL